MISRSYYTRIDSILELPEIETYYGDDIQIVTKCIDKYKAAFAPTGYTFSMLISSYYDDGLLYTITGSVSSSVVTYNLDTSNLPSDGRYKFLLYAEDGTECVYGVGTLNVKSKIE